MRRQSQPGSTFSVEANAHPGEMRKTPAAHAPAFAESQMTLEDTHILVSDAGIPGFDGIYYETPTVVANQRCQRSYAKGGPANTEYTLAFSDPMWYLQSKIAGETSRPYVGTDDGSCSPESVVWLASKPGNAPVPTVVHTSIPSPS